jgi:hypothetical protein
MYVVIYVYGYICTWLYMYMVIYVHGYICIWLYMYMVIDVYGYMYMVIYVNGYICIWLYMYVVIYVCGYICMWFVFTSSSLAIAHTQDASTPSICPSKPVIHTYIHSYIHTQWYIHKMPARPPYVHRSRTQGPHGFDRSLKATCMHTYIHTYA